MIQNYIEIKKLRPKNIVMEKLNKDYVLMLVEVLVIYACINQIAESYGSRYSRMEQVKFVEDSL